MRKYIIISIMLLSVVACDKYYFLGMVNPEAENVDERFSQSESLNEKHTPETFYINSDNYTFYAFSDTHLVESTINLDKFVSAFLSDSHTAPFTLCLGDIMTGDSDFDLFTSHTRPITDAGRRTFVTAGNHDLYWGRWPDFRDAFGSSTYWFEVKTPSYKDLFIALESGGGTLGKNQREWLENILKEKSSDYRNIILFTHTHFFMRDLSQGHTSNFAIEETYDLASLFSKYGVDLVITGHNHTRCTTTFKGIQFIRLDALEDNTPNASYAIFSVSDNIEVKYIEI